MSKRLPQALDECVQNACVCGARAASTQTVWTFLGDALTVGEGKDSQDQAAPMSPGTMSYKVVLHIRPDADITKPTVRFLDHKNISSHTVCEQAARRPRQSCTISRVFRRVQSRQHHCKATHHCKLNPCQRCHRVSLKMNTWNGCDPAPRPSFFCCSPSERR